MDFNVILNQVITLFLIMVAGFISRKAGFINEQVNKRLSDILLQITSPAMIFTSFIFEFSKDKLMNMLYVFGFTALIFVISIIFAEMFTRKLPDDEKPVVKTSFVFTNCGYMGFPILGALFGQEGIFYTSIFVVVYLIFLWTYGVFVFKGEGNIRELKRAFLSPSLFAVYIGLSVFIFQLPVPKALVNAADMLGSMTMPLAMLIIGAIFADADLKKMLRGWKVYFVSLIRLILLPVIVYLAGSLLRLPDTVVFVCVALTAMPVGANIAVFAEKYEKNPFLASQLITVSTFFSIFTIPVILYLI